MFVNTPAVYLCAEFVDFRKSINGLAAFVDAELELSVLSGALFVFCNKARDKLKLLHWDQTGFALWHKWLDKQKFKWSKLQTSMLNLTEEQLSLPLPGLDVIGHTRIDVNNKAVL